MRLNLRCLQQRLRILLLITLLACTSANGQLNEQKVFAPVPKPLRVRLVERLKLLVDYERGQRWNDQYNLLSPVAIADNTKEAYVKRRREFREQRILRFTPKYTALMYEGRWEIFGCVRVFEEGRTQELQGEVAAFWESGEWRFSQVSFNKDRCSR